VPEAHLREEPVEPPSQRERHRQRRDAPMAGAKPRSST
jgi:hypothetical protein